MAKKVKSDESVVVDVDKDVTSVSSSVTSSEVNKDCISHCGIDAFADAINEVPRVESEAKVRKSKKKVSDVALERQISDMEQALRNAKDAIESAAADNERLADELSVSVAENKSLRKELSKCKQDYKKCQGDNRANSALVDTLDGELTRQKAQNKELRETVSRLQGKIKQYADELSLKDKEISNYESDLICRDNAIAKFDAELWKYTSMSLWQRIKFVFVGGGDKKGK